MAPAKGKKTPASSQTKTAAAPAVTRAASASQSLAASARPINASQGKRVFALTDLAPSSKSTGHSQRKSNVNVVKNGLDINEDDEPEVHISPPAKRVRIEERSTIAAPPPAPRAPLFKNKPLNPVAAETQLVYPPSKAPPARRSLAPEDYADDYESEVDAIGTADPDNEEEAYPVVRREANIHTQYDDLFVQPDYDDALPEMPIPIPTTTAPAVQSMPANVVKPRVPSMMELSVGRPATPPAILVPSTSKKTTNARSGRPKTVKQQETTLPRVRGISTTPTPAVPKAALSKPPPDSNLTKAGPSSLKKAASSKGITADSNQAIVSSKKAVAESTKAAPGAKKHDAATVTAYTYDDDDSGNGVDEKLRAYTLSKTEIEAMQQLELYNRQQYCAGLSNQRGITQPARKVFPGIATTRVIYKLAVLKTRSDCRNWKSQILRQAKLQSAEYFKYHHNDAVRSAKTFSEIQAYVYEDYRLHWVSTIYNFARKFIDIKNASRIGHEWLRYTTVKLIVSFRLNALSRIEPENLYLQKYSRAYILYAFDGLHRAEHFRYLRPEDFPFRDEPLATAPKGLFDPNTDYEWAVDVEGFNMPGGTDMASEDSPSPLANGRIANGETVEIQDDYDDIDDEEVEENGIDADLQYDGQEQ